MARYQQAPEIRKKTEKGFKLALSFKKLPLILTLFFFLFMFC